MPPPALEANALPIESPFAVPDMFSFPLSLEHALLLTSHPGMINSSLLLYPMAEITEHCQYTPKHHF